MKSSALLSLPVLLRTTILLATVANAQNANGPAHRAFSVTDDLLAFPQFEIHLSETWTSEEEALARIRETQDLKRHSQRAQAVDQKQSDAQEVSSYAQPSDGSQSQSTTHSKDVQPLQYEYQTMVADGARWLCKIPQVSVASAEGQHAHALNATQSKAEKEKELARATTRGWELLSGMQGNCVYFNNGWWSYSFCYNQGVRQFHQLPPGNNVPRYPPVEDPQSPGFILGTYDKRPLPDSESEAKAREGENALQKESKGGVRRADEYGELVQRGETRYLVQRLDGGTTCDLTGKDRKIEVQFHCNPAAADWISSIKETSTCAYLMVIQTPRLCNDVAFYPPQKDFPNPISCSPILNEDEVKDYESSLELLREAEQEAERLFGADTQTALSGDAERPPKQHTVHFDLTHALEQDGSHAFHNPLPKYVGDIELGGRRLVPRGDRRIERGAIVGGNSKETYIDTVASSEGRTLSKADLERLGLDDLREVEMFRKKVEQAAQGRSWKVDVVDTPRGREYHGIIEQDKGEENANNQDDAMSAKPAGEPSEKERSQERKDGEKEPSDAGKTGRGKKKKEPPMGSEEEFFHEEL